MNRISLFVLFVAVTLGHQFHAENNRLCEICKDTVEKVQLNYKTETGLSDVNLEEVCHNDEQADCSTPCKLFSQALSAIHLSDVVSGTPDEVCQMMNWCGDYKKTSLLKTIPAQSKQMVDYINSVQDSWVAAEYPRYNQMSRHDFRKTLGTIVDESVRCRVKNVHKAPEGFKAPESFDSETNWPACAKVIGDIRDQSNCGCCWAFGAASAASDRMCISNMAKNNSAELIALSSQAMCFCASFNGCNGGDLFTPWSYIQREGLVTGGQFNGTGPFGLGFCADFSLPHCHHHGPQGDDPYPAEGQPGCPSQRSPRCPRRCDKTANGGHSEYSDDRFTFDGLVTTFDSAEDIQHAIMTDGPVEAAFTVYEDFANYVSGVYEHVSGSMEGGHAIRIVGWGVDGGKDYWKVANSWNPYWGENGYFRILRGSDECGIESQVTASSSGSNWSHKN